MFQRYGVVLCRYSLSLSLDLGEFRHGGLVRLVAVGGVVGINFLGVEIHMV